MIANLQLNVSKQLLDAFCYKWNVRELAIFGSALNDKLNPQSDVDVLVTFSQNADWSLFDRLRMNEELSNLFGRRVDLVEPGVLTNPFRRREILATRQIIYGA